MKKFLVSLAALFTVATASAQDELTVSGGADFVSNYVWRGVDQGSGPAVQPRLSLAYKGLTLGTWGSSPLEFSTGALELDFFLGYQIGNFSATLGDNWFAGNGAKFYGKDANHLYELTLAYTICESFPLNLSVNTVLFGSGDRKAPDKQNYSTYIALSYPFAIGDVDCSATVGLTPNGKLLYATEKDFGVNNIAFRAGYEIEITEKFALPIFCELSTNPAMSNYSGLNKVNAVFGMSLGF